MAELTFDTLRKLAAERADPACSLYLPTHRHGPEIDQDRIRLKNLLGEVEDELVELGHRRPAAEDLIEPARRLLDHTEFWQHRTEGLGVLLSADDTQTFDLPAEVEELAVVSDRFHLTPLLAGVDRVTILLLALSRGSVRLFGVTRTGIAPVEVEVPGSIADSAWFADREAQLQHHASGRGSEQAAYHGHDPGEDEAEDLRRFLDAVARGVDPIARDRPAPLVVAAVDELAAAYRRLAPHAVAERTIPGNPDELTPGELAAQGRQVIAAQLEELEHRARERTAGAAARGEGSADLDLVLQAATAGRVAEVVVDPSVHRWATPGSSSPHDRRMAGDDDLIDRTVALTLQHGGEAWALSATDQPITASFRF